MCNQLYSIEINKEQQVSPSHIRPLTQSQIKYAAIDSAVLPVLYDSINNEV